MPDYDYPDPHGFALLRSPVGVEPPLDTGGIADDVPIIDTPTCDYYDEPGQDCWTAGPAVIAAEGLCGPCAQRVLALVDLLDRTEAEASEHRHLSRLSTRELREVLAGSGT